MNISTLTRRIGAFALCVGVSIAAYAQTDVPTWAKKVVWYQIFPDRFSDGDSHNQPTKASLWGAYPHDTLSDWQLSPWTSDWYQLQAREKLNGKDIWYNLQRRRYGGDLQGIINKLDYLKDLGVGALYLNPIFYAPSLHKYDAICYHHVDPYFGPDPVGDMAMIAAENPADSKTWKWTKADLLALSLIREAHKRGMRIIFDGVFNHLGIRSFAFQDVVKNGAQSQYKDWFTITDWTKPSKFNVPFSYNGWFGVPELPEIREDSNGIVAAPRAYIYECTRRWMAPNGKVKHGIDGWRLDVAFCIAHPFWKDWRKLVRSINDDAYLTAELVDPPAKVLPYLDQEFDGAMNYNFAFAATDFFIHDKLGISPTEFHSRLKEMTDTYGEHAYAMQNLYDSHDSQRILSAIVNRDLGHFGDWGDFFGKSQASNNPAYKTLAPTAADFAVLKQMAVFQMTFVGAPMIYYGDEAGMWGGNDPDCRKPMVWQNAVHDPEIHRPDQSQHTPQMVKFNTALHDFYRNLIRFRNAHSALQVGDFKSFVIDDEIGVYGYSRKAGADEVIVIFNNSTEKREVPFRLDKPEAFTFFYPENSSVAFDMTTQNIVLPPKSSAIVYRK